jgi:glycogen(starch) synthase
VNKGFDLTIEALARLNWRMKQANVDRTVVFFLITRAAYRSINAEVLRTRAVMEEIRSNCEAIEKQVGNGLFVATAMGKSPPLDELVDDYWRLRLRRNLQAWRTSRFPLIVTHDLLDDAGDPVLKQLRACNLLNWPDDKVKVVYHPDFISSSDPLFGMDYDQFVRGCHFGVFPSLYEPWGYAPLECAAMGIPSVTSDTAGFGTYVMANIPEHGDRGLMVAHRRHVPFNDAANEICDQALRFVQLGRRERIALRNRVESTAEQFDWQNLSKHYREAHELALRTAG